MVALNDETPPDAITLQLELGRQSIAYLHSIRDIETLWRDVAAIATVALLDTLPVDGAELLEGKPFPR